jgi:hypothetical protein
MPLLLNALRNATGADSRNLRVKVLECAGFIGFVIFFLCIDARCDLLDMAQLLPSARTFSAQTLAH